MLVRTIVNNSGIRQSRDDSQVQIYSTKNFYKNALTEIYKSPYARLMRLDRPIGKLDILYCFDIYFKA